MEILLFGDQTADQMPLLRKLAQRKDNAIVTTFLERSSVALRHEIRRLPAIRREAIPDFLTIGNLVEAYSNKGVKIPDIESTLVTIAQLAHYMGYFEDNADELPAVTNTRGIGLCTGAIAAAAIASARSLSELIPLAVEAVKISFRTGACVGIAKDALERSFSAREAWSTIVTGTTERTAKAILEQFHNANGIDIAAQAYVSAVSTMAVTISGPPSTTKRLFAESSLSGNHRVPIPVYAPYHARHLYTDADIDTILNGSTKELLTQFQPQGLVHSAVSGECHEAANTYDLVKIVLNEVLREPVRWDRLLEHAVSEITALSNTECKVHAVGVTNVVNSLVSALKAGGQQNISVKDQSSWTGRSTENRGRTQNDKIAIVGIAGRFPNAATHEKLWELLMNGLDVHREIPKDRFDVQAHYDPTGKGKNKSHSPYGCFIDEPGLFDPRFFNMSPREAAQTDPMGRLALVTAYEALEMSGYVPNRTPSTKLHRVGTFYGQTSDDWREINAAENVDTYYITGGVRAFAPGRINYYFKFSGPSYSVDTACSSSLAAIQLACTSLWAGDCDTAVAGGLNVLTNPDIFSGLSKGQFLSKTGSCKTYDNDADGYCRADACASVILKRYEDAIADKDNVLACILGAGTNHSAEAVSITHPHAGAQEFLYSKVLADAGVDAHDISYVEMHGTGTQAGDGIEMTSVTNVFAPPHRRRRADQPLYLGAIKANIGHAEAASGINSLVKIMMMMREDTIPANVGIKGVMNKSFPKDLGDRNVHIPVKATALPRGDGRKIFLNNFSAAGGNTAVLFEDGPAHKTPAGKDPRSHQIITVTGRAISTLRKNINNLADWLESNPKTTLQSLSYTTTARRIQHNYRVSFTANDISNVKEQLLAQIKDTYSPVPMVPATTAFAFTGQGSQYTGLGQKLYEDLHSFKVDIDQLDNIARLQGLPSFLPLLQGAELSTLTPVIVQLGMSCIQVALARMWASWGIKPVAVVGHSLGEYAALHVAGVLSASDMIKLVGRRAEQLVSKCTEYTHGMLAVRGGVDEIAEALGSRMTEIACKNGPAETVLCGPMDVMNSTHELLTAEGFKATLLKVPFAFHSAQVEPIEEAFKQLASSVVYNKPTIPILSPLTGEVIRDTGVIGPDYLARHARECVDFWSALATGQSEGVFTEKTTWLEVGAHPVCSSMVKSSLEGSPITAPSLRRGEDPWKTIASSICTLYAAGVYINFEEYHREFNDAHELYHLPTMSFDNKTYWLDYHNNWTLTKGEVQQAAPAPKPEPIAIEAPPTYSTTSCQRLVREELNSNTGTVVFQSNLAEPQLHVVVSGHLVNGAPLCPSSLYADMALTASGYLYKQLRPGAPEIGLNVCKMEVPKPLIAKTPMPAEGQHIQIEVTADLEASQAKVIFRSVQPDGKQIQEHAHCLVQFEDMTVWKENWDMTKFMVQTQIDILKQKVATGAAHKVLRGMAYKLFKCFVDYQKGYQGMEEVVFDGTGIAEGTASVRFQADEKDGNFVCAPYWIDSLAHLSGFICNATDLIDSENFISISHGWGSMRFVKPFSATKTYTSYVRMQPQPGNVRAGDVYILEGDEIVGVVGGLKFQQIPRRVMDLMLPPVKKGTAAPIKATPAAPAPVKAAPAAKAKAAAPVAKAAAKPAPKPVKAPKAPKAPKQSSGSVVSKVMNIIAAETEVDMAELVDEAAFDNLGVDSLLSLTIAAKFREELELDIPSSLFTEYQTVGAMKKFFAQYDGASAPADDSDSETSDDEYDLESPADAEASTPPSSAPSVADEDEKPSKPAVAAAAPGGVSIARKVIAQEMGVGISEITDEADLTDLGMDSLMSLTILGTLREETGVDLPSTFLVTNGTIEQIEEALGMRQQAVAPAPKPKAAPSKPKSTAPKLEQVNAKLQPSKKDVSKCPPATSVLLQGNAKTATKKLFLFPDGSGSSTSYISIPNLGSDVAIYGLNCPFMKTPKDFLVGIDGVATLYMNEVKRRQPQGPYHLGGWSAGGVVAYEVACQLIARGDSVAKLILIDSPCPYMAKEPLPARLHHFFDQIGLLGTGGKGSSPDWLLPHFEYSIKALGMYEPQPMPKGAAPSTYAIWAREGVCGKPTDPRPPPAQGEDPAPMKWLLNNRTDFGDNGWASLLGKDAMTFAQIDGNHFSMMRAEYGQSLGQLIKQGLGA